MLNKIKTNLKTLKFASILMISVVLTLGLSVSLQVLLAAWQAPTANPPDSNIAAPINVGSSSQEKLGALDVYGVFRALADLTVSDDFGVAGNSLFGGTIGVGTTSTSNYGINSYLNSSNTSYRGINNVLDVSGTLTNTRNNYGAFNQVSHKVDSNGKISNVYAAYNGVVNNLGSQFNTTYGSYNIITNNDASISTTAVAVYGSVNNAAGTIRNAYGIYGRVAQNNAPGNIINAYGGHFNTDIVTGTITNGYGVYIADIEGTNQYGLYQNGSNDKNFFAGNVGINKVDPQYKLDINGEMRINGSVANAPDISLSGNGFISAFDNLYLSIDQNNNATGSLVIKKGTSTIAGENLMILNNDGHMGLGDIPLGNPDYFLNVIASSTLGIGGISLTGDVTVAPDIHFNLQGLLAADDTLRLNIDGDNNGEGRFIIAAGAATSSARELLTVLPNGQVGISTSIINANSTLQINPPASSEGIRIVSATNYSPLNIRNHANNTDIFRVDQGGNVLAFGDVNAGAVLRLVRGNYGSLIYNNGTSTYFMLTNQFNPNGPWNGLRPITIENITGDVSIGAGALRVEHGGNVGVGKIPNATDKLDVNGSIKSSGDICGAGKCLSDVVPVFYRKSWPDGNVNENIGCHRFCALSATHTCGGCGNSIAPVVGACPNPYERQWSYTQTVGSGAVVCF